ncbi:MAG: AraC family transcriptional regulator [Eubacterium sp.]|nr:AraC family transcriptional regulator [Eubacterium sp.]
MNYANSNLLIEMNELIEANNPHMSIDNEFDFYNLVSTGNRKGLEKRGFSLMDKGLGKLSDDKTKNTLYHFIISISLITRMCIQRGMSEETAYTLSDLYIQQVDKLNTSEKINQLHRTMVYDYLEKMEKIYNRNHFSRHIMKALKYIGDHISNRISVDDIAEALNLNKSYLCSLFKKETGITMGDYIERKKNELAIEYLSNSDMPFIDISNMLGYSSYSYFISRFKKLNGITPSKYRQKNHNSYLP